MGAVIALDVTIPGLRLVSEANARGAWHSGAKRAASQRRTVGLVLRTRRPVAVPCVVTITRIAPCQLDNDNLARAAKAVRDEVARWLGVDDRDVRVVWHVAQAKGRPREYAVRIAVRPWSAAAVGARVLPEGEAQRVEVVLTPTQRRALAEKLLTTRETRVRVGGVHLVLMTTEGGAL